jgi:Ca-activated chloride channel family protein
MMFFMPLVLILLPVCAALAQPAVFRAGVSSVRVDVQVVDRAHHVIAGLRAEDFQVFDDGRPQKIAYFGHDSEPLDLVLLLDVSGSMHRHLEEMATTARSALQQLHEGDRVGVMLFAREAQVRRGLTGDFQLVEKEIRDAVRDRSLGSGTAINSAILAVAKYLGAQERRGRRAVMIVTDNMSLNYKVPDDEVIRALYDADAVLNAILIGKQRRPDAPKRGYVNPDFTPSDVFKLAGETGGEAMESGRLGESFRQMIERIRARYDIQYNAPESQPGVFHRVTVEITPEAKRRHAGAVVRARGGYYGGG